MRVDRKENSPDGANAAVHHVQKRRHVGVCLDRNIGMHVSWAFMAFVAFVNGA
jgi:hypothetical protein